MRSKGESPSIERTTPTRKAGTSSLGNDGIIQESIYDRRYAPFRIGFERIENLLKENTCTSPVDPFANSTIEVASAMDDLYKSIESVKDYKWLARLIQGKTLRTTIRSFVKMFMKRELAVQFSWSGLGDKRASNAKVCFRDHDIRAVLDITHTRPEVTTSKNETGTSDAQKEVPQHTPYRESSVSERQEEIKRILAGASDWNSGRQRRKKATASAASSSSYHDSDKKQCSSDSFENN